MSQQAVSRAAIALALIASMAAAACGNKTPPTLRPTDAAQPPPEISRNDAPPAPPSPAIEPIRVPAEPVREDPISSATLDDLNRNSPLKPVFFELDSADITPAGQAVLDENGALLKRNATWTITIEGHCDERGTAEYNLALGERRAIAARAYLISLGLPAERLRTVSYGKEFPFDPGHDEAAMAKNRRAHFIITAK